MFTTRDGKCKKLNAYKKVFIHLIMKFLYEEAELYLPGNTTNFWSLKTQRLIYKNYIRIIY